MSRGYRGRTLAPRLLGSLAMLFTPLGFACFRLVPLGPDPGASQHAPMRLMEARGALRAFAEGRRK